MNNTILGVEWLLGKAFLNESANGSAGIVSSEGSGQRRVAIFGAGPLPAPGSTQAPGVANRCLQMLEIALAAGHECLVITLEIDGPLPTEKDVPEQRTNANGRSWSLLRTGPAGMRDVSALAAQIERFDPHVLISGGSLMPGATACRIAGPRPVWVDLFGDPLAEIRTKREIVGEHFDDGELFDVWQMMLTVLRRADAFSTVSRRQIAHLQGQLSMMGRPAVGMREVPIACFPCSLASLDLFLADSADRAKQLRERAGIPAGARVILRSGGWNAWEDPETLVAAFERLARENGDVHLVSTGGELPGYLASVYERFKALKAKSDVCERIHDLGWLPFEDALACFHGAQAGVVTDRNCEESRWGARNRLLFFAAAECPVAATSNTEVVCELGEAGALRAVPNGDAVALCGAWRELLAGGDAVREMTEAHKRYSRERFLFKSVADRLEAFMLNPERTSTSDPGGVAASSAEQVMDSLMDLPRYEREQAELQAARRRPLQRIKRKLGAG